MGSIQIIINQAGKPAGIAGESREDLSTGALVTLSNDDNTGVSSLKWELVSKPAASTAQLSAINATSPTFTPDVEGSYLIRLTLDGGLSGTAVAAIKSVTLNLRVPASGETDELGGWEAAMQTIVNTIEVAGGGGGGGAHTLGGPSHLADSLADLNAKISDANIDAVGTARPPSGSATGDLSGTYPGPVVDGLQGRSVASTAPSPADVLTWSGSEWAPAAAGGGAPSGPAGGDLGGTYPNPNVDGLQGRTVSSSAPNLNDVLTWTGVQWAPATTGSSPPTGAAGGDLGGTYPNPTVNGLRGNPINAAVASPADGYVIGWDGVGGDWNLLQPGGDTSGTFETMVVAGLQGRTVSAAAPSASDVLTWSGTQWAPAAPTGGGGGDGYNLIFADDTELTESGGVFVTKKTFRVVKDSLKAPVAWRVVISLWRDGGVGTAECRISIGADTIILNTASASETVVAGLITSLGAANDTLLTANIDLRALGGAILAHLKYSDIYAVY